MKYRAPSRLDLEEVGTAIVNSNKAPELRRIADDIYRHYSVPPTRTA